MRPLANLRFILIAKNILSYTQTPSVYTLTHLKRLFDSKVGAACGHLTRI